MRFEIEDRWIPDPYHQVFILVMVGLVLKLAIFKDVALNGDTGLFVYDAKQILWGRQMFVDFPSRSPVFEYLLAGFISGPGSTILAAKAMMILVSTGVGIAVYLFARQLHSHEAGLVGMALMYFVPYPLVWGLWVKTEVMLSGVIIAAFILAVHIIDRDEFGRLIPALIGISFGIAFLIRRSALVFIGAFAIFWLFYRYRYHGDFLNPLETGILMAFFWALVSALAYVLIGRFEPHASLKIADQHFFRLFTSDGAGVISWTAIDQPKAITSHESGSILGILCQKCGRNTIDVFARTILLILPLLMVLLAYLRSYLREGSEWVERVFLPVMLLGIGLLKIRTLIGTEFTARIVAVLAFMGAIVYVWYVAEPIEWQDFWQPKYALIVWSLVLLMLTYLWRDRILYITYFQDFYPMMAVLAGITAVEFYTVNDFKYWFGKLTWKHLKWWPDTPTIMTLLILAMFASGANAYPYIPEGSSENQNWFSVELVQEYGDDLEARTEPGERIFTAQPLYIIDADRRAVADLSRKYYAFQGWPDHRATRQIELQMIHAFTSGKAPYAILGHTSAWTLNTSEDVRIAVKENYCRVDAGGLYNETGSALYRYAPNRTDCPTYNHTEPRL